MAANIKVTVSPKLKELSKRIQEARNKLADTVGDVNSDLAVMLDRWVQQNFRSEGAPFGGWKKSRAAEARDGMTLQDTGRLRASFVPFVTNKTAGIGSDLDYALDHEEGLSGNPVRHMLPTHKHVRKDIHDRYYREARKVFKSMQSQLRAR